AKDPQHGRQMPNHFGSRDINYVTTSSPVGTQIPHAVGAAWAAKIRKDDVVSLAYFGDGATSEGDFHSGMNFAGVFKTPTIFFCKNNQWAISVPIARQTASKTIAQKAQAYGFEGVRVDGNDLLAVYAATKAAADKARAGGGPTLIEALTYRMGPHSSSDDPTRYRATEEVDRWREKDPIDRMRKYLELKGLWSEADDDRLRAEIDDLIQNTIKVVLRPARTEDAESTLRNVNRIGRERIYIMVEEVPDLHSERRWLEEFDGIRNVLIVAVDRGEVIGAADCHGGTFPKDRHVGGI